MIIRLWQGSELSQKGKPVTDSFKALRTLQCQSGRISIDPD